MTINGDGCGNAKLTHSLSCFMFVLSRLQLCGNYERQGRSKALGLAASFDRVMYVAITVMRWAIETLNNHVAYKANAKD